MQQITIVGGLPRSGTSLLMQMLDAAGIPILTDQQRRPDEDNPRGYYELEAVKRTKADPSWLADAPGKAVKLVHLLLHDLPATYRYRVLVTRRNIDEVLASQQKMLARSGKSGGALKPEAMKRVLTDQLDKAIAHLRSRPECRVLEVDYNALLADPAPIATAIAEFLELDAGAADCMTAVVDPALYRNRA